MSALEQQWSRILDLRETVEDAKSALVAARTAYKEALAKEHGLVPGHTRLRVTRYSREPFEVVFRKIDSLESTDGSIRAVVVSKIKKDGTPYKNTQWEAWDHCEVVPYLKAALEDLEDLV